MNELCKREVGFRVLSGHGARIGTTTPNGRLVFGLFATLAAFERELMTERTRAGLVAARAGGRLEGRPRKMVYLQFSEVTPTRYHEKKKDEFKGEYADWNCTIRGKTLGDKQDGLGFPIDLRGEILPDINFAVCGAVH